MKKILYLSSSTSLQGGAELCLLKIAKHFNNSSKYQTEIVLPDNQGIVQKYIESEIPLRIINFVRLRKTKSVLYYLRYVFSVLILTINLYKTIRKENIDLIHVNEIIDFPGIFAGKLANIPTMCHVRVIIENRLARKIFVWILKHSADRVICVSQAVKKKMFEYENIDKNKIKVIYDGGPDLNIFGPTKYNINTIRNEFKVDNKDFLIGFISKFVETNGQIHLVETAKRLYNQGFHNIRYMYTGDKVKGHESYFESIKTLIYNYGLKDYFIWTGFREDIPQIMKSCDLLVLLPLSTYEHPFPGVVLEAMAMEKPIIAFDSGGVCEQIVDGESGYIIPKGDIDKVVESIIELYHNPNKRIEIGKNARRQLLSKFSLERHFKEINQLYDELLEADK